MRLGCSIHRISKVDRPPRTVRLQCMFLVCTLFLGRGILSSACAAATVLALSHNEVDMPFSRLITCSFLVGILHHLFPIFSRQDMHCWCIRTEHVSPLIALTAYDPHFWQQPSPPISFRHDLPFLGTRQITLEQPDYLFVVVHSLDWFEAHLIDANGMQEVKTEKKLKKN
jgi:hypothetical protein